MKNSTCFSSSYRASEVRAAVICLALLNSVPAALQAGTIHQWTDAAGTTHFSDTAPPETARSHRQLHIVPAREAPATGLRAGERASLDAIDRQLSRQRLDAQRARRENDRAVAERRQACRERRARAGASGNHSGRRGDINYLRRNCW